MKATLKRRLSWSPDGIQVETFDQGDHDLPDRAFEVASRMGLLQLPENKARAAAPENKGKTRGRSNS
jgi:hypothetical protein